MNGVSSQGFQVKTIQFFDSFDNKELPIALADISRGEDVNFVAYNLMSPNNTRLKDDEFRGNMIKQLEVSSNTAEFRIVAIDFISQFDKEDDEHLEEFNNSLFEVANNKNNSDKLRAYAASHFGISKDQRTSKKRLNQLIILQP